MYVLAEKFFGKLKAVTFVRGVLILVHLQSRLCFANAGCLCMSGGVTPLQGWPGKAWDRGDAAP